MSDDGVLVGAGFLVDHRGEPIETIGAYKATDPHIVAGWAMRAARKTWTDYLWAAATYAEETGVRMADAANLRPEWRDLHLAAAAYTAAAAQCRRAAAGPVDPDVHFVIVACDRLAVPVTAERLQVLAAMLQHRRKAWLEVVAERGGFNRDGVPVVLGDDGLVP